MRHLLWFVLPMWLLAGCTDGEYDLSKPIDTKNIQVGNEDSVFEIPLFEITVSTTDMKSDSSDAQEIFDEVNIWLPSQIPGTWAAGEMQYVEINRMKTDTDYTNAMIDALFDEMIASDAKMDAVVDLIWSNDEYMSFFRNSPELALLIPTNNEELFKTTFKEHFGDENVIGDQLRATTRGRAADFMPSIHIDKVTYAAANMSEDNAIVDMLTKTGTVGLAGTITSQFPISFGLNMTFAGTGITTDAFVEPTKEVEFPKTEFNAGQLKALMTNFLVEVEFSPEHYYPAIGMNDEQTILMDIYAIKTGGLSLDLGDDEDEDNQ